MDKVIFIKGIKVIYQWDEELEEPTLAELTQIVKDAETKYPGMDWNCIGLQFEEKEIVITYNFAHIFYERIIRKEPPKKKTITSTRKKKQKGVI